MQICSNLVIPANAGTSVPKGLDKQIVQRDSRVRGNDAVKMVYKHSNVVPANAGTSGAKGLDKQIG